MSKKMDILSNVNNPMRVIYIPKGEKNINEPGVICDDDMIEFYDSRYPQTPDGQFISRYYVSIFLEGFFNRSAYHYTLVLDGAVEAWKIDRETEEMIINWIKYLRKERT